MMKFNRYIAQEILNADYETGIEICGKYLAYWQNKMDEANNNLKICKNDSDLLLYRYQYDEARKQFKCYYTIYRVL